MSALLMGRILFPGEQSRLDLVTNVKVLVRIDLMSAGSFVDLGRGLEKVAGPRELNIAFVFVERAYMRRDKAERWTLSPALNGLVCRIMREMPGKVELCWGVWKGLRLQMRQN